MLLSFTIDPNTLSLFLWQSEREKEKERDKLNSKKMRWKHTHTHIVHIKKHKGNRNLLNKKQFQEFQTKKKKNKTGKNNNKPSEQKTKKNSQNGILTNGQRDERNPLWISFVQYSYAECIMFPAVQNPVLETPTRN